VVLPKKGQQEKAQKIEIRGSKMAGQRNIEATVTENAQKGTDAKSTPKK
jgi:hypothetical protein